MSDEVQVQAAGASLGSGRRTSSPLVDGRGSDDARSSSSQSQTTKSILKNAHEAPKKPAKQSDSSLRSALKAAFVPPQPGKQIKTNGKPLGPSFERKEPLPVKHEGAEVLKADPRGQNASVGDGVVLSPTEDAIEDGSQISSTSPEQYSPPSGSEATDFGASVEDQPGSAMSTQGRFRERSDTVSSVATSVTSRSGSIASTSTNHCQIKFAPLPTSGRLKRANSITIGVAARSQLLHSQGAGRSSSGSSSAAAWQAQLRAQQQQQQDQRQQAAADRYSGIQEQQRGRNVEPIDLGVELRKSAANVWNRVRRGSSVSSSTSSGEGSGVAAGAAGSATASQKKPTVPAVSEEHEHEHDGPSGEKTPRRPGTPTLYDTSDDHEPDGMRTPQHPMQRRVSTGAFIGAQSFREMEEKRKRAHREEYEADGAEQFSTPTDEVDHYVRDDEAVNTELSAQFAEKLGRTGARRVLHHTNNKPWHPGMRGAEPEHETELVEVQDSASEASSKGISTPEGESSYERNDEVDDSDDEESREAQRLADEALSEHSAKATQAAGVERMDKKRSALARLVGA